MQAQTPNADRQATKYHPQNHFLNINTVICLLFYDFHLLCLCHIHEFMHSFLFAITHKFTLRLLQMKLRRTKNRKIIEKLDSQTLDTVSSLHYHFILSGMLISSHFLFHCIHFFYFFSFWHLIPSAFLISLLCVCMSVCCVPCKNNQLSSEWFRKRYENIMGDNQVNGLEIFIFYQFILRSPCSSYSCPSSFFFLLLFKSWHASKMY